MANYLNTHLHMANGNPLGYRLAHGFDFVSRMQHQIVQQKLPGHNKT